MTTWKLEQLNDVINKFKPLMEDAERFKMGEINQKLNDIYDKMIILRGLIVCKDWPQEIDTKLNYNLMQVSIIAIQEYISRTNIDEWENSDLAQINIILYEILQEFSRWIKDFSPKTYNNYTSLLDDIVRNFQ